MFLIPNSFAAGVILSTLAVHLQPSDAKFYVTAQEKVLYPDGVRKTVLTYDGLFPGPVVGFDEGDTVIARLNNFLQSGEPTTIHWHGLYQKGFQLEDGPSMIAQCPLSYGLPQFYNFTLEQTGTHWYHSHYYGQYTDGLFGAIVVRGANDKKDYEYHYDNVVMLSDHYHADWRTNQRKYMNTAIPPPPQSALINGHGVYHCKPELPFGPISLGAIYEGATCRPDLYVRSTYHVRPNRTHRFRVINASALSTFTFSIDYHTLWTMEVDGGLVHKDHVTEATHAVIAPGQIYSFLVDMNQPMGKYSIRAVMKRDIRGSIFDGTPFQLPVNAEELLLQSTTAAMIYNPNSIFTSSQLDYLPRITEKVTLLQSYTNFFGPVFSNQKFVDEMSLLPAKEPFEAPEDVDIEFTLNFKLTVSEDRHFLSLVNGKKFHSPVDKPLIFSFMEGEPIPEESNPLEVEFGQNVQIIINNKEPWSHPMHLHGHDFWILGKGTPFSGDYNPDIHFETLKTATVKRNVVLVPPKTWVVLRFIANNPGVWPFHCHFEWHFLGGMTVVFVSGQKYFNETGGGASKITDEAKTLCIDGGIIIH